MGTQEEDWLNSSFKDDALRDDHYAVDGPMLTYILAAVSGLNGSIHELWGNNSMKGKGGAGVCLNETVHTHMKFLNN